jgi:hypothetical protein
MRQPITAIPALWYESTIGWERSPGLPPQLTGPGVGGVGQLDPVSRTPLLGMRGAVGHAADVAGRELVFKRRLVIPASWSWCRSVVFGWSGPNRSGGQPGSS